MRVSDGVISRQAEWPADTRSVADLDSSFTTDRVYQVVRGELSFELKEEKLVEPFQKRYPLCPTDDAERQSWGLALVAEREGEIVGFAAAEYAAWNRRAILWHLYVAPELRGNGIGTRLLERVDDYARDVGARCLWVETQNTNYPAVRFYLRSGFHLSGLDETLYDPTELPGEVALFFTRPVEGR